MDALNQTLFTLWGYKMSMLELIGVLTGFAAVYLAYRQKSVNFLFGMLNNVVYFVLFFQFRLYSVMLLQIIYFIFSLYGFYHWRHPQKEESDKNKEQRIRVLQWKNRLIYIGFILVAGLLWGLAVIKLQGKFPEYFDPPAFPLLDAVLTMGSVTGQWMLSRKIWDNWSFWVIIDLISCLLYAYMGMFFTSVLYAVYTLIALRAVSEWMKTFKSYGLVEKNGPDIAGHQI